MTIPTDWPRFKPGEILLAEQLNQAIDQFRAICGTLRRQLEEQAANWRQRDAEQQAQIQALQAEVKELKKIEEWFGPRLDEHPAGPRLRNTNLEK